MSTANNTTTDTAVTDQSQVSQKNIHEMSPLERQQFIESWELEIQIRELQAREARADRDIAWNEMECYKAKVTMAQMKGSILKFVEEEKQKVAEQNQTQPT